MTNHVAPFAPIFSAKLFVADIDLLLIRPDKPMVQISGGFQRTCGTPFWLGVQGKWSWRRCHICLQNLGGVRASLETELSQKDGLETLSSLTPYTYIRLIYIYVYTYIYIYIYSFFFIYIYIYNYIYTFNIIYIYIYHIPCLYIYILYTYIWYVYIYIYHTL